MHSDVYKTMCNSLQQQNEINSEIIENLNKELLLKGKKLSIEKERLTKDSILYLAKAISEQDFQRQQSTFYDLQAAYKELHSSRLSYTAQIKRNEQQIQQYLLQEQETLDKLREELSVSKSQLTNTIQAISTNQSYQWANGIPGILERKLFCTKRAGAILYSS